MKLTEDQIASLRKWAAGRAFHVAAAVDLLIWHEFWFRRTDFTDRCVQTDDDGITWINWTEARATLELGLRGSTSELAILDFAIALGQDRYRFNIMGTAHSEALIRAVTQALTG
jgi:hypothetical protein